jgi:hypothetical protein
MARWHPGSRAEKLARLASLEAQSRRYHEQAEHLDGIIAAELASLNTEGEGA